MEECREQFEEWANKTFDGCGSKDGNGNYYFEPVQIAWIAWKASRAAIEIDLPDSSEFDEDDMSGAHQAICQIRETLTENGLTIKHF